MRALFVSALALAFAFGCSATATQFDGNGGEGSVGTNSAGSGAGGEDVIPGSGGSGGGIPGGNGCIEAAKLVYVLSDDNNLYSFDPPSKAFTKIGPLKCATDMSPNSMAVDRNAIAWVNYVKEGLSGDSKGAIYKVDTKDGSCEPTPAVTLPTGWFRVGMGFATDAVDSTAETLYIAATDPSQGDLGRIDPATNQLVPIGNFSGTLKGQSAELTGTGDAALYGFFTTSPMTIANIDKATGATSDSRTMYGVAKGNAWAFSFWGGEFYLYTATTSSSNVAHYIPSTGVIDEKYMLNVGFRIVGAGVSTCAPIAPPK